MIWWGDLKQTISTMADFFFFTDVDLLNSQTADQAYGPAGSISGKDRFRVTSIHSATGTPKAYAICDGQIAVQQDSSNADLIHIILKPSKQPDYNISTISYIIYKGILKSSLIDIDGNIDFSLITKNKIVSKIKYDLDKNKIKNPKISSKVKSEILGANLTNTSSGFEDDKPIEKLFYRETSNDILPDFYFPTIDAGDIIGEFEPTSFGIEIITESIGYEPKLGLARRTENYIEVLSDISSDIKFFEHWNNKEEILNFYDPAAFFGSFYGRDNIKAYKSLPHIQIKPLNIYTHVLKGENHTTPDTGNFFNRNTIYFDVRNEHNHALNYYQNYGNQIMIGFDDASPIVKDYYLVGWPILMIKEAASYGFDSTNNYKIHKLKFNLPLGDNELPLVYISQGFVKKKEIVKRSQNKDKFIEIAIGGSFTGEADLVFQCYYSESKSVTYPISTLIKIKYFKRLDPKKIGQIVSENRVIKSGDDIDAIFPIFQMKVPFLVSDLSRIKMKVYDEEVYIDRPEKKCDFIAFIGVAEEKDSYTFFAFPKDIHTGKKDSIKLIDLSLFTKSINDKDYVLNQIASERPEIGLKNELLKVNSLYTPNIQRTSLFDETKTKTLIDELYVFITIKKDDFAAIKSDSFDNAMGGLLNTYKTYLGISNRNDLDSDTTNDVSNDTTPKTYKTCSLTVKGFTKPVENNIQVKEYTPLDANNKTYKLIFNA